MSDEHAAETVAAVAAAEAAAAHAEAAEAEAQADATETAAEAAVALAHAAAAESALQAAETVRDIEEDHEVWKARVSSDLLSMSDSLRTLREEELSTLKLAHDASVETLNARLTALESHPALIRSNSEEEPDTLTTEGNPGSLVGAEAAANLGPAEAAGGVSLGAAEPSPPASEAPARRKRRWI